MLDKWRGFSLGVLEEEAKRLHDAIAERRLTEMGPGAKERAGENWTASPIPGQGVPTLHGRAMSEAELLTHLFTYHNDPGKVPVYDAINRATRICAEAILHAVPPCEDRRHALQLLRDVRMWANAAVACDGVTF